MGLVVTVVLVYLAVLVHELGHYLAYRRYGVPVFGFHVGGPPWLLRWKQGETEYRLGLLPLFGMVLVRWEDVERLPPGRLFAAFMAGPLFTFLAALSGFAGLAFLRGDPALLLKIVKAALFLPVLVLESTYRVLFLDLPDAGAIPLVQATGEVVRLHGPEGILLLWGVFNLVLFWFNLFPVPPLDGGQALFLLFKERRWFDRVYPYLLGFGGALMFALLEVAVLKDLVRLLGR